jgi:hypothetical protein
MNRREFIEIDPGLLPRLEALIEHLIELCDELSGDANREDDAPAEDDDTGIADGDALDLEHEEAEIAGRFAQNRAHKQARPDLYARGSFQRGVTRF